MKVELVGLTQPSVTTDCNSASDLVAWAARVSNPENQNNKETAPKLLKYLIKNEHWSPFEMVSIQMSITTTRDISRQIIRHRTFSFQEFSQRYAEAPDLNYQREARIQDKKNRLTQRKGAEWYCIENTENKMRYGNEFSYHYR